MIRYQVLKRIIVPEEDEVHFFQTIRQQLDLLLIQQQQQLCCLCRRQCQERIHLELEDHPFSCLLPHLLLHRVL